METLYRFEDIISNPGSTQLNMVAELSNKIRMDDACNIQFTSGQNLNQYWGKFLSKYIVFKGTTGKPKGVTLSHHNLVNNANQIGVRIGYSDKVGYQI